MPHIDSPPGPWQQRGAGRDVDSTWFTTGSLVEPTPEHNAGRPLLEPHTAATTGAQHIFMLLRRTEGVLQLPNDGAFVTGLPGTALQRNTYGTVRYDVPVTQPLLSYRVRTSAGSARSVLTTPPRALDLRAVGQDAPAINGAVAATVLAYRRYHDLC